MTSSYAHRTSSEPESVAFECRNTRQRALAPPEPSSTRQQIEAAFRNKQVQIQLWADGDGRIYRIQMISSTGDAQLDAIIRDDVLGSLMLGEPLPSDMPVPTITHGMACE
jgi:hypothetical protein